MAPGASIGRYRLDTLVSRGGMGEVWQAYDETLGRQVALKLLYEDLGERPVGERFLREARAIARLEHPNIVTVHDVGEFEGRPYLVMELLEGRTVADEIDERGPLPVAEVREIGALTAAALRFAHDAGVIHRDVKPANLVLTADVGVKLVDFGLARLVEESDTRLTPAGTAMGTIAYVAPECARGDTIDERSDLYSLGCLLYELLCGRPPFVGELPVVAYAHVQTEPDPPSTHRPDVPPDLETLVMALLAKDPSLRPRDADVVRNYLLGLEHTLPIPRPRAPRRSRRRRPALIAVGGLVAAAATIGVAHWLAITAGPSTLADRTESESSQSTPTPPPEQKEAPREAAPTGSAGPDSPARTTTSDGLERAGSSANTPTGTAPIGDGTGDGSTTDGAGDGDGDGAGQNGTDVPAKAKSRKPDMPAHERPNPGKAQQANEKSANGRAGSN